MMARVVPETEGAAHDPAEFVILPGMERYVLGALKHLQCEKELGATWLSPFFRHDREDTRLPVNREVAATYDRDGGRKIVREMLGLGR